MVIAIVFDSARRDELGDISEVLTLAAPSAFVMPFQSITPQSEQNSTHQEFTTVKSFLVV
jgi:hypothetical protein